jgi:hypothetical protein
MSIGHARKSQEKSSFLAEPAEVMGSLNNCDGKPIEWIASSNAQYAAAGAYCKRAVKNSAAD